MGENIITLEEYLNSFPQKLKLNKEQIVELYVEKLAQDVEKEVNSLVLMRNRNFKGVNMFLYFYLYEYFVKQRLNSVLEYLEKGLSEADKSDMALAGQGAIYNYLTKKDRDKKLDYDNEHILEILEKEGILYER